MKFTVALQNPVYGNRDELLYVARRVVFRTTSRRKAKKHVRTLIRKGYDYYDVVCGGIYRRTRKACKARATRENLRNADIPF